MNWTIYGMECVGALILFTCLIMIPLCKNPIWWIHDYPKDGVVPCKCSRKIPKNLLN